MEILVRVDLQTVNCRPVQNLCTSLLDASAYWCHGCTEEAHAKQRTFSTNKIWMSRDFVLWFAYNSQQIFLYTSLHPLLVTSWWNHSVGSWSCWLITYICEREESDSANLVLKRVGGYVDIPLLLAIHYGCNTQLKILGEHWPCAHMDRSDWSPLHSNAR
jgi:hypothetical protein